MSTKGLVAMFFACAVLVNMNTGELQAQDCNEISARIRKIREDYRSLKETKELIEIAGNSENIRDNTSPPEDAYGRAQIERRYNNRQAELDSIRRKMKELDEDYRRSIQRNQELGCPPVQW
jgi:DNA-binding transcriptional MerR regulator